MTDKKTPKPASNIKQIATEKAKLNAGAMLHKSGSKSKKKKN